AHQHVLEAAHLPEDAGLLEGADEAEARDVGHPQARDLLAGEADRAAVDRMGAYDRVEQRRLAGAVRADEADDLPLPHGEADLAVGDAAAIAFGDLVDLEQRAHSAAPPAAAGRSRANSRG